MAGTLPVTYRKSAGYSASFDWVDYSTGCGYRRYYPCMSYVFGTTYEYFLSTKVLDSQRCDLHYIPAGVNYATSIDWDFDIVMNQPCETQGIAYVNYSHHVGAATHTCYQTFNIYHVTPAGVETLIGTKSSVERATAGATRDCLKIDVTNKMFSIGDKLRLNILYISKKSAGVIDCIAYIDPASGLSLTEVGTTRTIGTDITFDCPFKIDI
jgi:hypothetical protein